MRHVKMDFKLFVHYAEGMAVCESVIERKKNIKMYTAFKVHNQKPLKYIRRSHRNAPD